MAKRTERDDTGVLMQLKEGLFQHGLSKTELWGLVRKYWLLVAIVFIFGTITMWVCLPVFFTEIYETKARLLVKMGRENIETPSTVQNGQVISQGVRIADINSEVQILSSRSHIETVVDRLGPDAFKSVLAPPDRWFKYPKYYVKKAARGAKNLYKRFMILVSLKKKLNPREEAILNVAKGVQVEPVRESDILTLKVQTPSADLSVDVANILLESYLERRIVLRRSSAGSEFFEARLAEAGERLRRIRHSRSQIREKWDLTSPGEQRTRYLNQLSSIESELTQNEAEIERLRRQISEMQDRSTDMPDIFQKEEVSSSNPSIQSIKERITALKLERAKISSRYLPDSETMSKINSEIEDLEAALAQESATILDSTTAEPNPLKRSFRSGIETQLVQISGLEARNKFLREPASRIAEALRSLNDGLDALEEVEREFLRAEQDYLLYSKKLEEARMSEELDLLNAANVTLIAPPDTPIVPIAPKKLFLMGVAMALSLLFGVAIAVLVETTEDKILNEDYIQGIPGVQYLGTLDLKES